MRYVDFYSVGDGQETWLFSVATIDGQVKHWKGDRQRSRMVLDRALRSEFRKLTAADGDAFLDLLPLHYSGSRFRADKVKEE